MNTLKNALDNRGLTYKQASECEEIKYQTIRKHYLGLRKVSAEWAILYEQALGIPRHELRPDLWEASEQLDPTKANPSSLHV